MSIAVKVLAFWMFYAGQGHWVERAPKAYGAVFHESYVLPNGRYCGYVEQETSNDPYLAYYREEVLLNKWELRSEAEADVKETCDAFYNEYHY